MRAVVGLLASTALVLAACSALEPETGWPTPDGPHDPAAEFRPDLIVAPETAEAGAVVELAFPEGPEETVRGIHFVLEARVGDGWQLIYHLTSAANGDRPGSFRPGAEGIGIPAVGIGGPGPDRVVIPADVPAGSYRICTGNAGDNFCAPIDIVSP